MMILKADKAIAHRVENHCLIGKMILDWAITKELVKCVTATNWKCKNEFSVSEIKRNMFLFSFHDKEDLHRVLRDSPWNVKMGLLILSPWSSGKVPSDLAFSDSPFWVQVHGLPPDHLTLENGYKIGEYVGKFIRIDETVTVFDEKLHWIKFFRILASIDVISPLKPGLWLSREGLPDRWIEFRYENLGKFCYKCGRIGHKHSTCKFGPGKAKFGPWMRAPSFVADESEAPSSGAEPRASPNFDTAFKNPTLTEICPYVETGLEKPSATAEIRSGYLCQKKVVKIFNSAAVALNAVIIHSRATNAIPYDNNWPLFFIIAGYLFYLAFVLTGEIQRALRRTSFDHAEVPLTKLSLMNLMDVCFLILLALDARLVDVFTRYLHHYAT